MAAEIPVARLDWRTLIDAKPDTSKETIDALDSYFEAFAQPTITMVEGKKSLGDQRCLKCDEPLTGIGAVFFGKGGFEWGIAHGEGSCRNCRWPARAHHFIQDAGGEHVCTLRNFILQYHPDCVSVRAKGAA